MPPSVDGDRTATATPVDYKKSQPSPPSTAGSVDDNVPMSHAALAKLDAVPSLPLDDAVAPPLADADAALPERVHLTQSRKALLLFLFCLSQFIDGE